MTAELLLFSVKRGLLLALQSYYVQRIDLNGSNPLTLSSRTYPIAVDYDYRFEYSDLPTYMNSLLFLNNTII